jgi:hypothetical protein
MLYDLHHHLGSSTKASCSNSRYVSALQGSIVFFGLKHPAGTGLSSKKFLNITAHLP